MYQVTKFLKFFTRVRGNLPTGTFCSPFHMYGLLSHPNWALQVFVMFGSLEINHHNFGSGSSKFGKWSLRPKRRGPGFTSSTWYIFTNLIHVFAKTQLASGEGLRGNSVQNFHPVLRVQLWDFSFSLNKKSVNRIQQYPGAYFVPFINYMVFW